MENQNTAGAAKSLLETITEKALTTRILDGSLLLVGEFRGQKIEAINYQDKETKKPAMFLKCTVNMEVGKETVEPVSVEVRLPKGLENPAEVVLGLTKGDRVAARLSSLKREKGITSASVDAPECLLLVKG